ncbi:metal ABC transporter solute-binding protein, Zn/Mn family [Candidatus Phytoplasma meliae]|uniref:Zinc ABC transporter substrate-binding protein n=1 Tax=Candidatus Phytoplasma meliae TaxID=1848402 RepID=A0ABS5CZ41_9MOLU|nr:zinc ABC transporter substrate-binding protein [Candidatus Phytoplasma meliae]MBP5836137.1 zinc ABC transporter substrate-binding protein [Candidatus Phytoplasma meliae]MBP5836240.1 zinc ABC transporter substrate-binding protein [Candidatus Phytoplasma meliae]
MKDFQKNKKKSIITIFLIIGITAFILLIPIIASFQQKTSQNSNKTIVTTTTMLQDLVKHLIGDVNSAETKETKEQEKYQKIKNIECQTLMGVGIDPHNYKTKLSDRQKIKAADLVIVNGLHLEAKMPDAFQRFAKPNCLLDVGELLKADDEDKEFLLKESNSQDYDPHIWFQIDLWIKTFLNLKEALLERKIVNSQEDKEKLNTNFDIYNTALGKLKEHIINSMKPLSNKVIVTAHDAFSYWQDFCQRHKVPFELESIQGISTQTEASNNKIVILARKLAQQDVKAIFTETSMPKDSLKSLKEEVDKQRRVQGFSGEIKIVEQEELYSDSLGTDKYQESFPDPSHSQTSNQYSHATYIGTFLNNLKIITENLSSE